MHHNQFREHLIVLAVIYFTNMFDVGSRGSTPPPTRRTPPLEPSNQHQRPPVQGEGQRPQREQRERRDQNGEDRGFSRTERGRGGYRGRGRGDSRNVQHERQYDRPSEYIYCTV